MKRVLYFMLISIALVLGMGRIAYAGEFTKDNVTIFSPWSRATVPSAKVGGGYFIIENVGAKADRLLSVTADVSDKVEIHEMSMEDGVMKMRQVDGVVIPAQAEVNLKPGALHLMFIGLKGPFVEGKTFPATLHFEKAGDIKVEFEIKNMGARALDTKAHENHVPQDK